MRSKPPSILNTEAQIVIQKKISPVKEQPKKFQNWAWVANSTAVLFSAFWFVCILQDVLVWGLGNLLGIPVTLSFDQISASGSSWNPSQVITLFGFIPLYFLALGLVSGLLYNRYRLKRDLRKLFFLWTQYFAFSIFAGSFVTSFVDRGNMRILWEYLQLNADYLPLIAFVCAALLAFFGTFNLWKFLNMAPSSEINKNNKKRLQFQLCVQVVPLLIFFVLGFVAYPNLAITSRFYSSLMVWVPVVSGIIVSLPRASELAKVPAFKESDIRRFQPIYWGLAALTYFFVLLIS